MYTNRKSRLVPWLMAAVLSMFAVPAMAADQDGDGITDAVENAVGLDPTVAQGGTFILTDGTLTRERPAMVADSDGNFHVFYGIAPEGEEIDSGMTANSMQVGYMMLDPDGNILIDETQLLTTGLSLRVNVNAAVASDDTIAFTMADRNGDLYFMHIDPSLDDQSGDAATPATIKVIAETAADTTMSWRHPQIAVDANDVVHLWSMDGPYMSFELDMTPVTAVFDPFQTSGVGSPNYKGHGFNTMAMDADGNIHVIFQDCNLTNCGISYGMLDGADGSILIDATPLYTAGDLVDEPHASQYNLLLDSTGMVNIVWRDKRGTVDATSNCDYCGSGGSTWFAQIDPSADDQDGSAADMTAIKVIDDTPIGTLLYFQAFIDSNDVIHLFEGSHNGLDHMAINTSGQVVVPMHVYSNNATDGNGWTKSEPAAIANGRIVWAGADIIDNNGGMVMLTSKLQESLGGSSSAMVAGGLLTFFEAFDDSGLPSGAGDLPAGLNLTATGDYWRMVITGVPVGGSASVTIDTGAALPEFWRVVKFNGSNWVEYGASQVSDTAFAITIVDGGDGDADGVANGIIVDPVGLATYDGATVQTSGGGGGGCTIGNGRQPFDPLFPMLLLIAGIYLFRRRQAN